jgi:predicted nucleic acid-binding protein
VIVADTSAILALIDRGDRHHQRLKRLFEDGRESWILPAAILPEVDYLAGAHISGRAQDAFLADLRDGAFQVAWGDDAILAQAVSIHLKHKNLRLGLVDAVVMATCIRQKASAIATLDLKHFAAVAIPGSPKLFPRDLT